MSTTEELTSVFSRMVSEEVSKQMKILEDTYFAKSKQTRFTKKELAAKWGCSVATASNVLKESHLNPIGKRGQEHEFDIEEAEEAKTNYDTKNLNNHELNWKVRTMQ